jgi:glycolate oxidase FAD binding subunit
MARRVSPPSFEAVGAALSAAAAAGETVRTLGAGTKAGWGAPGAAPDVELCTGALDRIAEHNAGDLTAVLEAGVPLARAQEQFAAAGQMLAVDPFLGSGEEATIGGVLATADSGPLRHRYGAPRDLVLGMTVALSDGTVAKSGGKVIKNVAGYDLGKLFTGSFGTLGVILSVSVRLHPLPARTVTVYGESGDPAIVAAGSSSLAAAPLELEALDVAWHEDHGGVLARCAGVAGPARAERVARALRDAGFTTVEIADDDAELWARQRAGQRSQAGALVRVAARPSALAGVLEAVRASGANAVGRAAVGHSFIELDPGALGTLLAHLPDGAIPVLLDAPPELHGAVDPWGEPRDAAALELMRRVKQRFDPTLTCNPGVFVGGI